MNTVEQHCLDPHSHYEYKLQSTLFLNWFNYHLRIWRSYTRAVCHYNYSLYRSAFSRWLSALIPISHRNNTLLRNALLALRSYRNIRLAKLSASLDAVRCYSNTLSTSCFRYWKKALSFRVLANSTNAKYNTKLKSKYLLSWNHSLKSKLKLKYAQNNYLDTLKLKHFKIWTNSLLITAQSHSIHSKYLLAITKRYWKSWTSLFAKQNHLNSILAIHHNSQKRSYFLKWNWYTKLYSSLNALSVQFNSLEMDHCRASVFYQWKSKTTQSITLQLNYIKSSNLHIYTIKKQFLAAWISKYLLRQQHHKTLTKVITFNNSKLLRKSLFALQSLVHQSHISIRHYHKKLTTTLFYYWIEKHKSKLRTRYLLELEPGIKFHDKSLLRKSIIALTANRLQNQHHRRLEVSATGHDRHRKLVTVFRHWAQTTTQKQIYKIAKTKSDLAYIRSLLMGTFEKWLVAVMDRHDDRRKTRVASTYYRNELLRRGLNAFIVNACDAVHARTEWEYATSHHDRALQHRALKHWECFVSATREQRRRVAAADQFRHQWGLRRVWARWEQRIVYDRQMEVKWRLAEAHHERVLVHRYLSALATYCTNINNFRAAFLAFRHHQAVSAFRSYFLVWKSRAVQYSHKLQLANRVVDSRLIETTKQLFIYWRRLSAQSRAKTLRLDRLCSVLQQTKADRNIYILIHRCAK
ncbi:hypothetical protein BC833DRAFT_591193 [Globomyces pollinis-pini]|nr:hypothetical protein BC833DRAFT_591193 [Globomyces pollinis-pini]